MPVSKADMQKYMEEMDKKIQASADSALDCFVADGKAMFPHHDSVQGKDAMTKFYKMLKEKDPKGEFQKKFTIEDVIESGDLVVIDGKFTATIGGKEVDHGKFLDVLRKDGANYKIVRSMWNTSKAKEGHH